MYRITTNAFLITVFVFLAFAYATDGGAAEPVQGQGYRQTNTMGGGPAAIPDSGKFRVFILAGQSNMTGQGRVRELTEPHNKPHDRIRIWANGRWEYFVPSKNFGPGVAMAHQLAEFWPEDTIGVIKVAIGGTGILAFAPDWTKEQADRTGDGRKGNLYKDIVDAVTAARKASQFEIAGFVWKQGGKDSRSAELAKEYSDNFKKMVTAIREDVDTPKMPAFIATYMSDDDIGKVSEDIRTRRPGLEMVLRAQNRAARDIPGVVTVHHGRLPTHADGIHFNTKGQLKLGEMVAGAVKKYYEH